MTDVGADDLAVYLPDVIVGLRLNLVLLSVAHVLSRDGTQTPVPLGYPDPTDVLNPAWSPIGHRIPQLRSDPTVNPWLIRLAVTRTVEPKIVGLINFHDAPDERGFLEIGYSVIEEYRRQGYAREMAHLMWAAARKHPAVRGFRASASPDNKGSLAIIRGAGLLHVGEQDDPEDGLEYVFECTVADYVPRMPVS
ncbi:MAG: GNAT family N-acetyltransferase [Actinomycetes bacterium]